MGRNVESFSGRQIRRVPFILRSRKEVIKYFEPKAVTIGPLNHGKPELQWAEALKRQLAESFMQRVYTTEEFLLDKIKVNAVIEELKSCYAAEDIGGDDRYNNNDELARIFLIDGCAVLRFIVGVVFNDLKQFNIRSDIEAFITQDLFLLENQLPYRLFELLVQQTSMSFEYIHRQISVFIEMNCKLEVDFHPYEEISRSRPIVHLLDLLRTQLVHGNTKAEEDEDYKVFLYMRVRDIGINPTFGNIKELKAVGIEFKPTATNHLTGVEFKSRFLGGTLKLPPLPVDRYTASNFLNIVAYEMCPDFPNNFEFISYLCFLDSLINQAEDVKELRKAKVLFNYLGRDEIVAQLFNEISTGLVPNPEMYSQVKMDIESHCNKKWSVVATWIAQAIDTYFSNPWAFIASIAAASGLAMTFIQTWYAMKTDDPCSKVCTNNPH